MAGARVAGPGSRIAVTSRRSGGSRIIRNPADRFGRMRALASATVAEARPAPAWAGAPCRTAAPHGRSGKRPTLRSCTTAACASRGQAGAGRACTRPGMEAAGRCARRRSGHPEFTSQARRRHVRHRAAGEDLGDLVLGQLQDVAQDVGVGLAVAGRRRARRALGDLGVEGQAGMVVTSGVRMVERGEEAAGAQVVRAGEIGAVSTADAATPAACRRAARAWRSCARVQSAISASRAASFALRPASVAKRGSSASPPIIRASVAQAASVPAAIAIQLSSPAAG